MRKTIKIGKKFIGEGHPCFVIAEAGSNHNGNYTQALKLIDAATAAGADAVKFQCFKAEKLYTKKAGKAQYLKNKKSIYDIIKEMEMPVEWIPKLAAYCRKKKIIFLSSPFDESAADMLEEYVPAYKIASYEMTHLPLVKHIAKKGKPIIMSTGTATIDEIKKSIDVIKKASNNKVALMQCTACYPTPLDFVNVKAITVLKKTFGVPVGLSDHSREYDIAPMAAVAVGADCIEKHFTPSNKLKGPDHKFAVEPRELRLMIQKIRAVEKALGSGQKTTLGVEKELRTFARRSVFAVQDINKGERFTKDNIAVLRRGICAPGIDPGSYEVIIGKHARKNIRKDTSIKKSDF